MAKASPPTEKPGLYDQLRSVLDFELPDLGIQGGKAATGAAKDLQHRRNKLASVHLDVLRRSTLLRDEADVLKCRAASERMELLTTDEEVAAGKNAETRNAILDRKLKPLLDELAAKERKLQQLIAALQAVYAGESALRSAVRLLGLQVSAVVTRSGATGEEEDDTPQGWIRGKD